MRNRFDIARQNHDEVGTSLSFTEEDQACWNAFFDPITTQLRDLRVVQDRECARKVLFLRLRAHALQRHRDRNRTGLGFHWIALLVRALDQCTVLLGNAFSPARIGTFSQFSAGGSGQSHSGLYAQLGLYA